LRKDERECSAKKKTKTIVKIKRIGFPHHNAFLKYKQRFFWQMEGIGGHLMNVPFANG
jgi:hypothetical protein